ncbi:hypothetical protein BTM25_04340 [Actinomadura rubteroloni]|uniref:DUF397 domain-containing protein n=1 Tax=Actinomadura rubteroloni TaxID=1926885 RepID=A0A2P4ULX6_9ACTN|nr:DUF397 domain-containing protein [Actinomadura rubteroloni]POM26050.1 hypothetical protein BTM25_04340 [Actinomadura rubteroloni]
MSDNRFCTTLDGADWRVSSRSGSGADTCVEVATNLPGVVGVRDSVDADGPRLAVASAAWRSLTTQIKAGAHAL